MTLVYEGKEVFYNVAGHGPACLFLHGFIENHSLWDDLLSTLTPDYRCIVIDLPGHGKSELPGKEITMATMAGAVHAVLEHLAIDKATLVGHSMGGYVGLAFAEKYPDQVSGLLLLNSSPFADDEERIHTRKHGISVARKNYEAIINMSIANLFSDKSKEKLKDTIEALKGTARKTPVEGYIAAQKAMMKRPDRSKLFSQADFKRCILLGDEDSIIDAETIRNSFEDSNIKIKTLSGGHLMILENLQDTAKAIQDFLKLN